MVRMRMNQAVAAALADEMREDPDVVVFGEDIAVAGGPFKTSDGLLEEFGPSRVRDTPISEMGFLGMAVGSGRYGPASRSRNHVHRVPRCGARPGGDRGRQVQLPVQGGRSPAR